MGAVDVSDSTALHKFTVAKHGVPVGDGKDFGESVRHVDDANPLGRHAPDSLKQYIGFAFTDGGGGLVHDQNLALKTERLGNFDQLRLGQTQGRHERFRV